MAGEEQPGYGSSPTRKAGLTRRNLLAAGGLGAVGGAFIGPMAAGASAVTPCTQGLVINARCYGGGTGGNDSLAIQTALSTAAPLGAAVYLGRGNQYPDYTLTQPITVPAGVTLYADGAVILEKVRTIDNTGNFDVFLIQSSNVTIRGLRFQHTGSPSLLDASGNPHVLRLIHAAGTQAASISNVVVEDCQFEDMTASTTVTTTNPPTLYVTYGVYYEWVNQGRITGCLFEPAVTDGAHLSCSGPGIYLGGNSHITVRDNTLVDTGWASILLEYGNVDIAVEDNTVAGTNPNARNEGGSIDVPSHIQPVGVPSRNQRIRVSGNYITGPTSYTGVGGLRVASADGVIIERNVFDQVGQSYALGLSSRGGMTSPTSPNEWLGGPNDMIVRGNLFYCSPTNTVAIFFNNEQFAPPYTAPLPNPPSEGLVISDNVIRSSTVASGATTTTHSFASGIYIDADYGGVNMVTIHDNVVEVTGALTGAIAVFGQGGSLFGIEDLLISGNRISYTGAAAATSAQVGIFLGGLTSGATVRDNSIRGFYYGITNQPNSGTPQRWLDDNFINVSPGPALDLSVPLSTGAIFGSANFAGTLAGGQSTAPAFTVPGAPTGAPVSVTPPAGLSDSLTWVAWVSAANTVTLSVSNVSASATPVSISGVWNVTLPVLATVSATTVS